MEITPGTDKLNVIPLRWMGLGFTFAWIWWLLFNGFALPMIDESRLAALMGFTLACFLLFLIGKIEKKEALLFNVTPPLSNMALMSITVIMCLSSWGILDVEPIVIVILTGLSGFCLCLAIYCWIALFYNLMIDSMTITLLSSLLLSAVLYSMFMILREGVGEVFLISLPVFSLFLFYLSHPSNTNISSRIVIQDTIVLIKKKFVPHTAYLALVWLGTGLAYASQLSRNDNCLAFAPLGIGFMGALTIVFLWLIFSRKSGTGIIQYTIVLLLAVFGVLHSFNNEGASFALAIIIGALLSLDIFLTVVICLDVAKTFSQSLRQLFGSLSLVSVLAFISAILFMDVLYFVYPVYTPQIILALFFTFALAALAINLLFSTTWIAYEINSGSTDEEDSLILTNIMTGLSKNIGLALTESYMAEPDEAMDTQEFVENLTRMSKDFDLSPRQGEILMYLVKGRNADYIANKLVISTNTVRTHIASIYRKVDVHTQNELMNYFFGE